MKIKLERLIMRNDIIFKRSVQFRDQNKNSWTVDFEVYKEESTRINRETLQKFKQSFSVYAVIDTSCEDLRTRVTELTNGRGVDVVLDNIGLEWSVNEGVYMVRPGGKVLVCGYISEDFKVNYQEVMKFEKEILGMRGMTRQDMAEVVELVNQRKIVPYVYKTVPFEQINEALGLLRDGKTKGRVVLLFPED